MPSWLLNALIPFAFQAFTPMLVLGAKWLADWFKMKLPGPAVLVVASAIGETINQVGPALSGVEGLPPGTSAIVAVGLREFYSQMIAQPVGLEAPSLEKQIEEHKEAVIEAKKPVPGQLGGTLKNVVLVLALGSLVACGEGGDADDEDRNEAAGIASPGQPTGDGNVTQVCNTTGGDGGAGGDGNTDGSGNGGDGGDGGPCVFGDGSAGGDQDNSSEETNEAPPAA